MPVGYRGVRSDVYEVLQIAIRGDARAVIEADEIIGREGELYLNVWHGSVKVRPGSISLAAFSCPGAMVAGIQRKALPFASACEDRLARNVDDAAAGFSCRLEEAGDRRDLGAPAEPVGSHADAVLVRRQIR